MKLPNSRAHLDAAIQRLAATRTRGTLFSEIRAVMAQVVVGQMLPDCVVKGGGALKIRYGREQTRFTMDFDMASRLDIDVFIETMRDNLAKGWCEFTGTMDIERPASPKGVPAEYVMRPFMVHLDYHGKSWYGLRLEFSHNEIGDADESDLAPVSPDITAIFTELGFPEPEAIPLMPLRFQVAQKLHGLTTPGSKRVRDLIDLQLIMRNSEVDLAEVGRICHRLFAYRKCQAWPPTVQPGQDWAELYAAQKYKLTVLPEVGQAVAWANDLIRRIEVFSAE